MTNSLLQKCIAEFIGTFAIVFFDVVLLSFQI